MSYRGRGRGGSGLGGPDRLLHQHVQEFLAEHRVPIDDAAADDIAFFLKSQSNYPQVYNRRSRGVLRFLVEKVLVLDRLAAREAPNYDGESDPDSEISSDMHSEYSRAPELISVPDSASALLNATLRGTYTSQSTGGTSTPEEATTPITKNVRSRAERIGDERLELKSASKQKSTKVRTREVKDESTDVRKESAKASATRNLNRHDPSSTMLCERPTTRYSDLGGLDKALQDVRELVERPLQHPEIYKHLGVQVIDFQPPHGVLLHGVSGCGKTTLAQAIAGELGVSYFKLNAPEVVSGVSGESEARLRQIFNEASQKSPSLIFIDEIDVITPKRSGDSRGMERRIVAQLINCLDDLSIPGESEKCVIVLAATSRAEALDPALRRAGRFDREIALGVPDERGRCKILAALTKNMRLAGNFDFNTIAQITPGYVGADLSALCNEAASIAVNRIFTQLEKSNSQLLPPVRQSPESEKMDIDLNVEPQTVGDGLAIAQLSKLSARAIAREELKRREAVTEFLREHGSFTPQQLEGLTITMEDFMAAVKNVQPSAQREGFATIPNVSWDDVGALEDVRAEIEMALLAPLKYREAYEKVGLTSTSSGLLLYGPPGNGKTLLAKAIATEAALNFLSVKGPELLNKYVGESERAVRSTFARARASAPCLIFFDEIDALVPRRGGADGKEGGENVSQRLVNQMLTELDGLDARQEVFVVAASNRPDMIDQALLRPGRIDKLLYLPLPKPEARVKILQARARHCPLGPDVDLAEVGMDARCTGYSGADLGLLVREAQEACLRESFATGSDLVICRRHFEIGLQRVLPSVTERDEKRYEMMNQRMLQSRTREGTQQANSDKRE